MRAIDKAIYTLIDALNELRVVMGTPRVMSAEDLKREDYYRGKQWTAQHATGCIGVGEHRLHPSATCTGCGCWCHRPIPRTVPVVPAVGGEEAYWQQQAHANRAAARALRAELDRAEMQLEAQRLRAVNAEEIVKRWKTEVERLTDCWRGAETEAESRRKRLDEVMKEQRSLMEQVSALTLSRDSWRETAAARNKEATRYCNEAQHYFQALNAIRKRYPLVDPAITAEDAINAVDKPEGVLDVAAKIRVLDATAAHYYRAIRDAAYQLETSGSESAPDAALAILQAALGDADDVAMRARQAT